MSDEPALPYPSPSPADASSPAAPARTRSTRSALPRKRATKKEVAKAAKAAKKATKKKAAAAVPAMPRASTGQSGSPLTLTEASLNPHEQQVLEAIRSVMANQPVDAPLGCSIKEAAAAAFPEQQPKIGNSRVRNALRRLVRGKFIRHSGRGTYATATD